MERETLFDNVLVGYERLPQPDLLAQMFNLRGQRLCRRRDLDASERRRVTETLQMYHAENPFTLIVIEHDVDLVRRLCRHTLPLAEGRVIASGAPNAVLDTPAVRIAYFGHGHHA